MVTYLILARPFKILVNLFQQLVCQLILLTVNICLVILAIEDIKSLGLSNLKENLGNIIILCSTIVNFVPPVFLVLKIIDVAFRYYKTYRQTKKLKNIKTSITLSESAQANLNSSKKVSHQSEAYQNNQIRYSQNQQVQGRASQLHHKINAPNPLRYNNQRAVPNIRKRLPKNIFVDNLEDLLANRTNSPIFYRNTAIDSPLYNISLDNSSLNTSISSVLKESPMKLSFNNQQSIIKLRSVENSNDISINNLSDGSFQNHGLGSAQKIKQLKNKNNHLRNQNSPTSKIKARNMKFAKK